MEGSVRWEEWYTVAAKLSHSLDKAKYLLARSERLGRDRLVEGRGCQFREGCEGQPGVGAGMSRRNRNSGS